MIYSLKNVRLITSFVCLVLDQSKRVLLCQSAYSPWCSPYISCITSWENLHKHHMSCLVIITFILMTCMFD